MWSLGSNSQLRLRAPPCGGTRDLIFVFITRLHPKVHFGKPDAGSDIPGKFEREMEGVQTSMISGSAFGYASLFV